ncbi:MAG: replication initiator [Nocardioidaceae bacterium]
MSFAKVAEFQARGLVHFHAVVRLDGPNGSDDPPPAWASTNLLTETVIATAASVAVPVASPDGRELPLTLRWGDQLDVQPVFVAEEADGITDTKVAGYVAKYATKAAEVTGTVDRPIRREADIDLLDVSEHARRMIRTCFDLGRRPQYAHLRTRAWAHMLDYRGHFSSKSRRYSTTLTARRQKRADYRASEARERLGFPAPDEVPTRTEARWSFVGQGYTPGEALLAEGIRARVQEARRLARQRNCRQET